MTSVTEATRAQDPGPPGAPRGRLQLASQARGLVLPFAIVLVPLLVIAYSFWPGHMSADTLVQIDQVKTGHFTNQHAPLLMALWKPFYSLGFGPGWLLGVQLIAFASGCWLILRTVLGRLATGVATAAICLSPPVFGMLGYLSRDVWFTALMLLTFGLTARAVQRPERRRLWIGLAIAAAWLALAARQNAAPTIVLALIVLGGLLLAGRAYAGRRRIVAAVVAGVLLCVALLGTQLVATEALGVTDVNPEQYTMIYDLAAISHRERQNLFPSDVMPRRGIGVIDKNWNVDVVNTYLFVANPPIKTPLSPDAVSSLRSAWLDAIADHPIAYLESRGELQGRQLGIGRAAVWIFHPVIDPNPFGFTVRHPGADAAANDYVEGFADDNLDGRAPFYILWLYMIVAIAAGIWLLLRARRTPALLAAGALGLGALTFQAGLFVGAMGIGYRLEWPMVVSAILCAIVAVAARRRNAPVPR